MVSFTPQLLYLWERAPGTHWIGGWVGPRAVLDVMVKRKIPTLHWELNSIVNFVTTHVKVRAGKKILLSSVFNFPHYHEVVLNS